MTLVTSPSTDLGGAVQLTPAGWLLAEFELSAAAHRKAECDPGSLTAAERARVRVVHGDAGGGDGKPGCCAVVAAAAADQSGGTAGAR